MYLTNALRQRFMSHMSDVLATIQYYRDITERRIILAKQAGPSDPYLYICREIDKECYVRNSTLQSDVKRGFIDHRTLQEMEKVVTLWINLQQDEAQYAYEDYLDNRYDPFYRNRSKQAKQKLAKLVELQQAIRKQKRITRT